MRRYRLLAAAAVLATAALSAAAGPAVASPVARASTSAEVYACGMAGNWRCPMIRPGEIGFGSLWDIAGVHWAHWTANGADGTGMYWLGRGVGYRADIALTNVKLHGSQRYFANALITAAGHRPVRLWYGSDHGAVGWWRA